MAEDSLRYSILHNDSGSSDKIYELHVKAVGGGRFKCTYRNGRRGGTMASGDKTPSATSLDAALEVFERVRREKIAKGYREIDHGTSSDVPSDPDAGRDPAPAAATPIPPRRADPVVRPQTGIVPQLLLPVDADRAAALLQDDDYALEEKQDGQRRTVAIVPAQANMRLSYVASGWTRKGLQVELPDPLKRALQAVGEAAGRSMLLDGEQIGDEFVAWTILELGGEDLSGRSVRERREVLDGLDLTAQELVVRARCAVGTKAKMALYAAIQRKRGEGAVFKRLDAPHQSGLAGRGSTWLKHKFTKTLSAIVAARNAKRSVSLALLCEDGSLLGVGNVTIPSNHAVPAVDAIVEVEYLYAFDGGSLYQPVYLGVRDDVDRAECLAAQRIFKDEAQAA